MPTPIPIMATIAVVKSGIEITLLPSDTNADPMPRPNRNTARISENAIFARLGIVANDPAAVPPAGEDESEPSLLASALAIEDNVLFCEREAVALNGPVLHVLSTRVIRNEVLGCAEVAISALGLGTPASSIAISANSFAITGHGIRCGLGGAWVEGNKIVNSPTGRRDPKEGTIGIAMVATLFVR